MPGNGTGRGRKRGLDEIISDLEGNKSRKCPPTKPNRDKMATASSRDAAGTGPKTGPSESSKRDSGDRGAHMDTMFEEMFSRFDRLEDRLMDTVREAIRKEIDSVRAEFTAEVRSLSERVTVLESKTKEVKNCDQTANLNLIIKNLGERDSENILSKVNGLIKDGLKLRQIECTSAERKVCRVPGRPGIVIAKCKSAEDKRMILENKRSLRNSRNFKDVFIEQDIPQYQRTINANMRTIMHAIGDNRLEMRGTSLRFRENYSRRTHDVRQDEELREHRAVPSRAVNSGGERRSSGTYTQTGRDQRERHRSTDRERDNGTHGGHRRSPGRDQRSRRSSDRNIRPQDRQGRNQD